MLLHKIVIFIGTIVLFLSFLFAFVNRKKANIPNCLKFFYINPLLATLISISTILYFLLNRTTDSLTAIIEKSFFLLDFIFWIFFFYQTIINKSMAIKTAVIVIGAITLLATSLVSIFIWSPYIGLAVANTGKFLFCIVYFFSLFNSFPTTILKNDPIFWIVIGLFFYTTFTLPTYITNPYLNSIKQGFIQYILFAIGNIAIIIMHILFIKGQVCIIRQYKKDKRKITNEIFNIPQE